ASIARAITADGRRHRLLWHLAAKRCEPGWLCLAWPSGLDRYRCQLRGLDGLEWRARHHRLLITRPAPQSKRRRPTCERTMRTSQHSLLPLFLAIVLPASLVAQSGEPSSSEPPTSEAPRDPVVPAPVVQPVVPPKGQTRQDNVVDQRMQQLIDEFIAVMPHNPTELR